MFYLLIIYVAEFVFVEPEKRDPVQDDLSARIGDAAVHLRV
jgi:hypothetical protein